jgi:hypothetical protein
MAKFRFDVGAEADLPTITEQAQLMGLRDKSFWVERARGVKPMRFAGQGTVSSGSVTIPGQSASTTYGSNLPQMGPSDGFAWAVQRITCYLITNSSDVLYVYRGSAQTTGSPNNFLGILTQAAPTLHVGGKGLFLLPDEQILVTGSSLTTTGTLTINGEAIEAPAEQVWKIV